MTPARARMMKVPLQLEESDVWRCLGGRDAVLPGLTDEVAGATSLALELARPQAVCRTLVIDEVGPRAVTFKQGPSLQGKFVAHLFSGAHETVFVVATIGTAVEERVSQLFTDDDSIGAVILDAAGTAAAMNTFTVVLNQILEKTQARGWQMGACVAPGQSYWDIEGQQAIFQTLPAARIGVELLEFSFMRPRKSQSGIVPLGPDLKVHGDPEGGFCRYCQAARCPLRSEPQLEISGV